MSAPALPAPIKRDSRICFGILYFGSEADADAYAAAVETGTYNGGYLHGMATGRDKTWDHVGPDGTAYYAVTTA